MGVLQNIFGNLRVVKTFARWRELGTYKATFSAFGTDMYQSDLVRSCIRPLAEHTSKATAKCTDKRIEKILNMQPNMYMNGKDFLAKVRIRYELKNTAFIFIQRDDTGKVIGYYPVPYSHFEAVEYNNGLFIRFSFGGEAEKVTLPWEDLAVLRKDYNESDIAGDDNTPILNMLELINTSNQGIANAVKATANLRGILKSTKAMLASEDIKKQKEQFVKDYLNLENEGGIASLDSTQEFTPITMSPTVTNYAQMKEFRENVYRYFGVNDSIIMNDYTESQMEAFYDGAIESFLVALSLELTRKSFSDKAKGHGNAIVYEANRLQFASMSTKISIFKEVVLYGGMTRNEWREGCNLAPIPGGDIPIMRLDASKEDEPKADPEGGKPAEEEEEETNNDES